MILLTKSTPSDIRTLMKTIPLNSNHAIPAFGLGTWKSEPEVVYEAVKEAIRVGYRHIDCASIYGNEAEVGRALAESIAEGVVKRNDLWITSKLWNDSHAPEDVKPALEQALGDLQLEYLDLYLMHWPIHLRKGTLFPESGDDFLLFGEIAMAGTWKAMEALVEAGLAKTIGVSNFSIPKLENLLKEAALKPVMNQVEAHPYFPQGALLEFCRQNDIAWTAYCPLGSSDRPAFLKAENERSLLDNEVIGEIAARNDASPAQVLIAWAIQRGTVVIPKSANPARIAQNLKATELVLDEDDMEQIAALESGVRYVTGEFWEMSGSYTVDWLWNE